MFTTGLMIFLGIGLLLAKLPRRTALKVLKHDLALDIAVTVLVLLIHWGTFSGVMAATVAGRSHDQPRHQRPQIVDWLRRRQHLPPGQDQAGRVVRRPGKPDHSLRWIFLAAASGETGRQSMRILIRVVMRLLR